MPLPPFYVLARLEARCCGPCNPECVTGHANRLQGLQGLRLSGLKGCLHSAAALPVQGAPQVDASAYQ